jgi:hypothetical protein
LPRFTGTTLGLTYAVWNSWVCVCVVAALIAVRPFNIDVTASFRRSTWWQYYTIILQQVAKGCPDPQIFLKQMILLKLLIFHPQGLRLTVVIVTGLVLS